MKLHSPRLTAQPDIFLSGRTERLWSPWSLARQGEGKSINLLGRLGPWRRAGGVGEERCKDPVPWFGFHPPGKRQGTG